MLPSIEISEEDHSDLIVMNNVSQKFQLSEKHEMKLRRKVADNQSTENVNKLVPPDINIREENHCDNINTNNAPRNFEQSRKYEIELRKEVSFLHQELDKQIKSTELWRSKCEKIRQQIAETNKVL